MITGTVEGRLWKDAETFNFGDGKVGLKISLVSNNSRAYALDNPPATWVNATLWRGGEKLASQFVKGRQVVLMGEIEQLQDKDKNNYNVQINVEHFVLGAVPGSNRNANSDSPYNNNASESFNGGADETPKYDPFANEDY